VHSDRNPISPVRLDRWTRESIVDHDSRLVDSVGGNDLLADGEVVGPGHSGVGRILVWVGVLASPWAPRFALWHGSPITADPRWESARVRQSEFRFAVCVFL